MIAVDSFVCHYAAAHGIPVLSLFGPTLWRGRSPGGSATPSFSTAALRAGPAYGALRSTETSYIKAFALNEALALLRLMTEQTSELHGRDTAPNLTDSLSASTGRPPFSSSYSVAASWTPAPREGREGW